MKDNSTTWSVFDKDRQLTDNDLKMTAVADWIKKILKTLSQVDFKNNEDAFKGLDRDVVE